MHDNIEKYHLECINHTSSVLYLFSETEFCKPIHCRKPLSVFVYHEPVLKSSQIYFFKLRNHDKGGNEDCKISGTIIIDVEISLTDLHANPNTTKIPFRFQSISSHFFLSATTCTTISAADVFPVATRS